MSVYQKVKGWIGELFSIGIDGPQIVWDSTNDAAVGIGNRIKFLLGDKTDPTTEVAGDMSRVAGADPTEPQDFITKTYGDTTFAPIAASAAGAIKTIEIPLVKGDVSSTVSSAAVPPVTAMIVSVKIRVDTVFDNADNTVTVGNATDGAAAFAAAGDSKLNKLGTYEVPQYTDLTAAEVVDAVVAGSASPVNGVAFILIEYTTPEA